MIASLQRYGRIVITLSAITATSLLPGCRGGVAEELVEGGVKSIFETDGRVAVEELSSARGAESDFLSSLTEETGSALHRTSDGLTTDGEALGGIATNMERSMTQVERSLPDYVGIRERETMLTVLDPEERELLAAARGDIVLRTDAERQMDRALRYIPRNVHVDLRGTKAFSDAFLASRRPTAHAFTSAPKTVVMIPTSILSEADAGLLAAAPDRLLLTASSTGEHELTVMFAAHEKSTPMMLIAHSVKMDGHILVVLPNGETVPVDRLAQMASKSHVDIVLVSCFNEELGGGRLQLEHALEMSDYASELVQRSIASNGHFTTDDLKRALMSKREQLEAGGVGIVVVVAAVVAVPVVIYVATADSSAPQKQPASTDGAVEDPTPSNPMLPQTDGVGGR